MKKLITLLLVLVLSFSLFASCKKKQESTPESTGTPTTSETAPESKPESKPESTTQTPALGESLAAALAAQVKAANSMKIELHADVIQEESRWDVSYSQEVDENGNPIGEPTPVYEKEDYYMEIHADVVVLLSKDADGLDASVTISGTERYDETEELEAVPEMTPVYIIDNDVYVINYNVGGYVKQAEPSDMLAQLTAMANGEIISAEDEALLFGAIGEIVATVFEVKDGKGSISIDAKPAIVGALDYIKALDLDTKKVGDLVNDVLAVVDPTLKIADLLVEVKRVAGLTVNQALAEIDAFLTKNYATTLQGIYDELVADDELLAMVLQFAGAPADQMTEIMAQIKAMKIADMIEAEGMGDVVLYDMFIMMTGETEGAPNIDDFFGMIDSILAMTLAEFDANFEAIFAPMQMMASFITVNALDAKMDVAFTNVLSIDYATVDVNVDFAVDMPSEKAGETDHVAMKMDLLVKVSEISGQTLAIAIPEELPVYDFLATGHYDFATEDMKGYLSIYSDCTLDLNIASEGMSMYIYAGVDAEDLTSTTITITADDVYRLSVNGMTMDASTMEDLVIILDPATQTFTIANMPE